MVNFIKVHEAVLITLPDASPLLPAVENVMQGGADGEQMSPFVGGDISEQLYQQICQILKVELDFDLVGYKDLCIKRRIAARIRTLSFIDPEGYLELLKSSGEERERLLEALTIHVSQFYRNPSTFAVLEKKVLPDLLQQARENKRKLRVWSAGCAGGEEPYTIALLCAKLFQSGDLLSIVGTDISADILQRAKQARFNPSRLAEVPAEVLKDNFICQDNGYQLTEDIQEKVRFFRHDILSEQPNFRVDLILCRNLLIYFSRPQQELIIRSLAQALQPGGYLVLGRAETLVASGRELFQCIDPAERIYQRLKVEECSL